MYEIFEWDFSNTRLKVIFFDFTRRASGGVNAAYELILLTFYVRTVLTVKLPKYTQRVFAIEFVEVEILAGTRRGGPTPFLDERFGFEGMQSKIDKSEPMSFGFSEDLAYTV